MSAQHLNELLHSLIAINTNCRLKTISDENQQRYLLWVINLRQIYLAMHMVLNQYDKCR